MFVTLHHSFLNETGVTLVEFLILLWVRFRFFLQELEKAFRHHLAQLSHESAVLHGLTGNIEGQVFGIDDSF